MVEKKYNSLHSVLGDFLWRTLLPRLPIRVEGTKNMDILSQEIREGGSILFASNHESHLDFLVIAKLLQEHIVEPHKLAMLASMKFHDSSIGFISGIAHYLAQKHNYSLIPVIQRNDHRYSDSETAIHNANILRETRSLLAKRRSIVGVFPEGGRNDDGKVTEAQRGSALLMPAATLFVPMAVIETRRIFPKKGLPSLNPAKVIVGDPILTPDIVKKKAKFNNSYKKGIELHDAIMMEILRYIPPKYWGVYADRAAQYLRL